MKSIHDLLAKEIQALYSSTTQLVGALPRMGAHANNPELAAARAALELGPRLRETAELHERMDALEKRLADDEAANNANPAAASFGVVG